MIVCSPISLDSATDCLSSPFSSQLSALLVYINELMDKDSKASALKQLQGHMWEVGYKTGELISYLYEDAIRNIRIWSSLPSLRVCIYSSGSITAQKLLFGYTNQGSLLDCLSHHFDTSIGMKQDTMSYHRIISSLSVPSHRILFVTDVLGEAKAAAQAGINVLISVRPGNAPVNDESFTKINSFDEICLQ